MTNTQIRFSYVAIALGAFALFLALAHNFAGPFAPRPSIGTSIGELAGEIRAAATRALAGAPQPAPTASVWDIDRVIAVLIPALAVLGIVSGILGLLRQEPRQAAIGGVTLGICAILAQVFFWVALMICGIVLIWGVMRNMETILE